jgi:hypothetical protein
MKTIRSKARCERPVPLLGLYQSAEASAAQVFALALVAVGFRAARPSAVAQTA